MSLNMDNYVETFGSKQDQLISCVNSSNCNGSRTWFKGHGESFFPTTSWSWHKRNQYHSIRIRESSEVRHCLHIFPIHFQVVITKLRSSASAAQEHDHQNWKAAKALLVIIPLLGITYLFTISGPSDPTTMAYYIFQHVRAFLLSIQVQPKDSLSVAFICTWLENKVTLEAYRSIIWCYFFG